MGRLTVIAVPPVAEWIERVSQFPADGGSIPPAREIFCTFFLEPGNVSLKAWKVFGVGN